MRHQRPTTNSATPKIGSWRLGVGNCRDVVDSILPEAAVKSIAVISIAVIGITVSLLAQEPERRPFWAPKLGGEFTPTAADELARGPVPRMPDGHPDLHGPWVGGGSNDDIESEGGLKPGELPLLPWAKALRDSRKEDDEPYLYCTPMSVPRFNPYPWNFIQSVTSKGPGTIYIVHENGD